jgi:cell shape-determining protein MreC
MDEYNKMESKELTHALKIIIPEVDELRKRLARTHEFYKFNLQENKELRLENESLRKENEMLKKILDSTKKVLRFIMKKNRRNWKNKYTYSN